MRQLLKTVLSSGLVHYCGPSDRNQLALTFDDGPVPGITDEVVRELSARGHHATFFMVGQKAQLRPKLLQAVIASGSEIANHTYSHKLLSRSRYVEVETEVSRTDEILQATAAGQAWFRPPGGHLSWKVFAYLWRRGERRSPVLWSICVPHENRRTKDEILHALKSAHPSAGDIILLHDDHPVILEALPGILDLIEEQGLRSVSVGELLRPA